MILDELVLHNFGVYRGRQCITLTPPSPQKPVVLFGGLNGGGKTTLLDGLQLALFGKAAHCSNRGALAYSDFLERSINSSVSKADGASLEVQFRHRDEGKESSFRVRRSWQLSDGGNVKERLEVLKDGREDSVLAEAWAEHVDEFMPVGISNLFLFDGEKIEGLAEVETSSRLLASAIGALLGLDLVDQLATDLVVLERRKRATSLDETDRTQVEAAQRELSELRARLSDLTQDHGAAQNEVDRADRALAKLHARFQREGGDLYEKRIALETERQGVLQQINDSEEHLREIAAGSLPLAIATPLLEAVTAQDALEAEAEEARALRRVLEQRDATLIQDLKKRDRASADWLVTYLTNDRQKRTKATRHYCYLYLNADSRTQLAGLPNALESARRTTRDVARKLAKLRSQLDRLDRTLASVPSSEAIQSLQEERETTRSRLEAARGKLAAVEAELQRARHSVGQKEDALQRLLEHQVKQDFATEDALRIVRHSQKVRGTLVKFRQQLLHRHVARIEALIFESFQQLLHKQTLISGLSIDPQSFNVQLRDRNGVLLPAERLSAGERQLLAISMLWGLAKASGRPLPAVIDTPLGRLDSSHRCHLVRRYFPFASHQVLLLSTDQEIDQHYFEELRPHVGRSYLLDFDDQTSTTSVREGYFW